MAQALETEFKKAVWLIRNGPKKEGSTEQKLNFYKYYKQATVGNVQGAQPYRVQFEARSKWDAWNSVKDISKEDAMKAYIALMGSDWLKDNEELLKNYKEEEKKSDAKEEEQK